jgi:folate-dependent phosphoribosylglycinamide formyltransferase PurN
MTKKGVSLVPIEVISSRILMIRGERIMLDADLAELYGVETKRLNEQARRNKERFPEDFMFQLTSEEKAQVVANCDHLSASSFLQHCHTPLLNMAPSWQPVF